MYRMLLFFVCLFANTGYAQNIAPGWYVLDKGAKVSIIRPGTNDVTRYMTATRNKPLDKAGVDAMEELIDFSQGDIVLVHDQVGGYLIATDIEGRNLGIKGNITRADRGPGSGPGYMLDNFTTPDGKLIKKNSFVWVKERKPGAPNVTVQYADKKMITIPADKVYDINTAAAQMASDTKPKTVQ